MGLLSYVDKVIPGWMLGAKYAHWLAYATTIAGGIDALVAMVDDAAKSDMPGQVNDPGASGTDFTSFDALPLIGRDRRIVQGLTEDPWHYALELRRWRDTLRKAGTFVLLERLAAVLSPNPPRMRIVTAGGQWYTRETDGTIKLQNTTGTGLQIDPAGNVTPDTNVAYPWDWDSLTVPVNDGQGDTGRIWIIVYLPCNPPYFAADEGVFGDGFSNYGDVDKVFGVDSTSPHIELLRNEGQEFKAGGVKLSHFILAFDDTSFDPLNLSPDPGTMPDGTWGQHTVLDFFGMKVRSRLSSARYVRGTAGTKY